MGIKAERLLNANKESITFTTQASGSVTFPASGSIATVAVLDAPDTLRFADIQRAIDDCIEYIGENELLGTATSVAVVRGLNGSKKDIVERTTALNIVTGDVGVMLNADVRVLRQGVSINSALNQVKDYSREQTRLGA